MPAHPLLASIRTQTYYPTQPKVKSLSHVRLCNPMDCSLPGSTVYGIFQARILEWVAISFSRRSSWPRDWTWVSHSVGIVGRRFTIWATREVTQPKSPNILCRASRWLAFWETPTPLNGTSPDLACRSPPVGGIYIYIKNGRYIGKIYMCVYIHIYAYIFFFNFLNYWAIS